MSREFNAKECNKRCTVQCYLRYKTFNLSWKLVSGAKVQIFAPKFEIGAKSVCKEKASAGTWRRQGNSPRPTVSCSRRTSGKQKCWLFTDRYLKRMTRCLSICPSICPTVYQCLMSQHLPTFLSARHISCLLVTYLVWLSHILSACHISCMPVTYLVCLNSKGRPQISYANQKSANLPT